MTETSPKKKKVEWTHCNTCGHDTRHTFVAKRVQKNSDYLEEHQAEIWSHTTYEMLECGGCESIVLKRTYLFSEDGPFPEVTYFPPAVSRKIPAWHVKLSPEMVGLVNEIYAALHADSRRLATMGARALLDMLILDKVGDVGTFSQKLDALVAKGLIVKMSRDLLEAALDAGNAASHRGHQPTAEDVSHVMDIVENLFQAVYVLQPAASELKKSTPPRPPTPEKK